MNSVYKEIFDIPLESVDIHHIRDCIEERVATILSAPTSDESCSICQPPDHTQPDLGHRAGRLGPNHVILDKPSIYGTVKLANDRLTISSDCNFSSARANAGVFTGKYMFEATLNTNGVMQIGWAPVDCPFNPQEGVGDFPHSYAYDGGRRRKWNVQYASYGQFWESGDVIGACIDLDAGHVSFYRNGVALGVAFNDVCTDPPTALFPALSLSQGDSCTFNFGATPFTYPVEGYRSLHEGPTQAEDQAIAYVHQCLERLLPHVTVPGNGGGVATSANGKMEVTEASTTTPVRLPWHESVLAFHALIDHAMLGLLGTTPHAVAAHWVPLIMRLALEPTSGGGDRALSDLWKLLRLCLEPSDFSLLVDRTFARLGYISRTALIKLNGDTCCHMSDGSSSVSLSLPQQCVVTALKLLEDRHVLGAWMNSDSFSDVLESFLVQKQPNANDLTVLLPSPWWRGLDETDRSQELFEASIGQLSSHIAENDRLRRKLLYRLFDDVQPLPPSPNDSTPHWATPSQLAHAWLDTVLVKNKGALRNVPPAGLSDNSSLVNLFYSLLHRVHNHLPSLPFSDPDVWRYAMVDDPLKAEHLDLPRFGGLLSHLKKNAPLPGIDPARSREWLRRAPGEGVARTPETDQGIYGNGTLCSPHVALMLDRAVLLYHHAVSMRWQQALGNLQKRRTGLEEWSELASKSAAASTEGEGLADRLLLEKRKLRQDLGDLVRQCAWDSISLFRGSKQELLFGFSTSVSRLLCTMSDFPAPPPTPEAEETADGHQQPDVGHLFSYVPSCYLESTVDSFHSLRRCHTPSMLLERREEGLGQVIEFFVRAFPDSRIVNPDMRELLLQSVSLLLQTAPYGVHFARNRIVRERLPHALFDSFDSRLWVTVANTLARFCRGEGFVPPALRPRPTPMEMASTNEEQRSAHDASFYTLRQCFREACATVDPTDGRVKPHAKAVNFVNALFNQLNWTLTELGISMREILRPEERRMPMDPVQLQRRVVVMFDLACSLLKVLEMTVREAFVLFDTNADACGSVNLTRACEVILHVLNNYSIGCGTPSIDQRKKISESATYAQLLRVPDLGFPKDKISAANILAPVSGLLLELMDCPEPPRSFVGVDLRLDVAHMFSTTTSPRGASGSTATGDGSSMQTATAEPTEGPPTTGVVQLPSLAEEDMEVSGPKTPVPSSPTPWQPTEKSLRFMDVMCSGTVDYRQEGLDHLMGFGWGELDQYWRLRITQLQEILVILENEHEKKKEEQSQEPPTDVEMCAICCASPANSSFVPCGHESCHGCITRHLLNSKRCFFCNTEVSEVKMIEPKKI